MDARLLPLLACPACRAGLEFEGQTGDGRVQSGTLSCGQCGRCFVLRDEVAVIVLEGTQRDGARWGEEWATEKQAVYQQTSQNAERWYASNAARREMVDTALRCRGLVLDIGTGPGGSIGVPFLRRAPEEALFVASDLGEPVMRGQHAFFRDAGLAPKASFLVFDARRMPLLDGSVSMITSVLGLTSVLESVKAYQEAYRVLKRGGWLIDQARVYEPGSQSGVRVRGWGGCCATSEEWLAALRSCGFVVERMVEAWSGRGKTDSNDDLPVDEEPWSHIVAYAHK
jgi:ubiquinone/menaquinone biosynthesis C-methylase UbiE/uncharacterized protein YbaR (Trm112 family)